MHSALGTTRLPGDGCGSTWIGRLPGGIAVTPSGVRVTGVRTSQKEPRCESADYATPFATNPGQSTFNWTTARASASDTTCPAGTPTSCWPAEASPGREAESP